MLWRCSSKIKSHFFGLPLPSSNVMTLSVMTFAMHHESPCRFARRQPTCFESLGGSRTRHYPTRRLENFFHMQATISRQDRATARQQKSDGAVRRCRLRGRGACDGAQRKNRSSRREDVVCNVLTPHCTPTVRSHLTPRALYASGLKTRGKARVPSQRA